MNPFDYLDYRQYIRDVIEKLKLDGGTMNYSRLSQAMGIQKSYLSQVLSGRCHLSSDQIYLGAGCLGLDQLQGEYLILLLEIAKTSVPERRSLLETRRDEIRKVSHGGLEQSTSMHAA